MTAYFALNPGKCKTDAVPCFYAVWTQFSCTNYLAFSATQSLNLTVCAMKKVKKRREEMLFCRQETNAVRVREFSGWQIHAWLQLQRHHDWLPSSSSSPSSSWSRRSLQMRDAPKNGRRLRRMHYFP